MTIITSQPPYRDDFNKDKGFYRVLYKPGYPVQARELTQQQTAIQHQLEKFGKHIFDEGSIVTGGQFDIDLNVPYVLLSTENNANPIAFQGKTIKGRTSGVSANVLKVERIVYSGTVYYPAFIRYISGSETSETSTFIPGETIFDVASPLSIIKVRTENFGAVSVLGNGSLFTIEDGVVFSKGLFIDFSKQSLILDAFSKTPTCRIGFNVIESIITPTDDESLLDPSNGTPNYNAPGADRLKISATLKKIEITDTESLPDFVELFTIKNGVLQEKFDRPQYAVIGDEIAKRTYDESGDYCIKGMGIRIREHLDTGVNEGYLTAENDGNPNLLTIDIEPGLAYVKGYEINKLVSSHISTSKSIDYEYVNSQILSARSSNYILIDEIVGTPVLDVGTEIDLYYNGSPTNGEKRVTNNIESTVPPTGIKIGTAKIKSILYEDGVLGAADGTIRLYLYDIQTPDGAFTSVDSVYCSSPYFFADAVKNSITGKTSIYQRFLYPLIYPIGTKYTKTVRSDDELSDTTFTFQRTNTNISISTGGIATITIDTAGEQFGYGAGSLSSLELKSIFLTITEDAYRSSSLVYLAGSLIDLSAIAETDVVIIDTTKRTMTIDLHESFDDPISAAITYNVTRSSAYEVKKLLRSNRYVKIDCSTVSIDSPNTLASTPIYLGFSDIFKIKQIKKYSGAFPSIEGDFDSTGTDVTDDFTLNTGQTDDFYDHGFITLRPGKSLSSNDRLVIKLDYFYPSFSQGVGYFSVDSYPINDSIVSDTTIQTHEIPTYTSSESGITYDLRDVLDFRPVRLNSATDSITRLGASENPSNSTSFYQSSRGLRIPVPASQILIDYSYYLARRDIVALDKNGVFSIINGIPAIYPTTPSTPETLMGVAKLYIPPYPSISTAYARLLNRSDIGCKHERITFERHTMRDIGVLKSRIKNLEYYTSMNLLEKQTKDMLILDENGLDRFKNGFFIDPFVDHSLGNTKNDDYKISIDKVEHCIRPFYTMESFLYNYDVGLSNNVQIGKSIITLPYSETVFLEQLKATSYRNIEQSVFRYIGLITMTPDTDIWVDTTTVDKTIQQDFSYEIADEFLGTEWGAWEDYVVGYNVYDRRYGDRSGDLEEKYFIGTYATYAEALAAAQKYDPAGSGAERFLIETETKQQRTGTELTYHTETATENFGTFVTDTALATYIRPQRILVHAKGLKPNTRFHCFFDNEKMNDFVVPLVIPETWDRTIANLNFNAIAGIGLGAPLKSDSYGDLVFFLVLPASGKRFRVGTKEVKITDSPTNAIDATSYAISYFVAHGLIQQKQNTILSTKYTVVDTTIVSDTRTLSDVEIMGPSCMAYSFYVKAPKEEDGIFMTSVDVWIQSLHESLGAWFEIREMNSAGGITRTQVPYSEVWMYRNDSRLKISEDGITNHTRINFENPVFLLNNTQYAFVIHTEGLNPDTYFYVSRIGENDLETGQQVTARQLTGNVYTTNNNLNWDIVPDIDLKIRFNRAQFSIGTGTAAFKNTPNEFWTIQDRSAVFTDYGEEIKGSQILTLEFDVDPGTDTIDVGDSFSVSGEAEKVGTVIKISDSDYYIDGFNFEIGDVLIVENAGSPITKDVNVSVIGTNYGSAKLVSFNRKKNSLVLSDSNGLFFDGCVIEGQSSGVTATITSVDDYYYSTIHYNPNTLTFANTTLSHKIREIITASGTFSSWQNILPRSDVDFNVQRSLMSRSNEIALLGGVGIGGSVGGSAIANMILSTTSDWVSPVIDMNRTSAIFIYNIVNDDITGEDGPFGGNLWNKYISKTITLAEGQDAEDLIVYLSAYAPNISELSLYPIKVWAKIINNEDGDFFQNKNWIELTKVGDDVFSSTKNKQNYKELTFQFDRNIISDDEINPGIQYISNGNTYTGFKQYAIKIGLLGNPADTAIIPKVADLRAIALQL